MKRALALFIVAVLTLAAWAPSDAGSLAQAAVFEEIGGILATLEQITGLKPLKPVPHELISREEVKRFLEKRIAEEIKPEELRAEELVLKKFGFVPRDFDLKKTTIELLTEQAAAFYDYRKKKLFVLESDDASLQRVALIHELAHALADQHFNLDRYIRRGRESDDGAMARLAVMEGQAMWIMAEAMAKEMNLSLKKSPALAQYMGLEMGRAALQSPEFQKAPLYIRETLLFPYTKGILFQQAVLERHGQDGFAVVYRNPPLSTQHILHPEEYFAGRRPTQPPLPQLRTAREYRTLAEGSIGQLDHAILLRQYASAEDAEKLPPLWRGGVYRLLEHKREKRTVLAYAVEWDSAEAAQAYLKLYARVLEGKWEAMRVLREDPDAMAGQGDEGWFIVRRVDNRVSSLEGLKSLEEERRSPQSPKAR